eukprot:6733808-Pyramimonas_sp.AAC.1
MGAQWTVQLMRRAQYFRCDGDGGWPDRWTVRNRKVWQTVRHSATATDGATTDAHFVPRSPQA